MHMTTQPAVPPPRTAATPPGVMLKPATEAAPEAASHRRRLEPMSPQGSPPRAANTMRRRYRSRYCPAAALPSALPSTSAAASMAIRPDTGDSAPTAASWKRPAVSN